jgi:hypothetical protein
MSMRTLARVPRRDKRALQRIELDRLRRELREARAFDDRDLTTLLAYAAGSDGDPLVGLLDEARATVSLLADAAGSDDERAILVGLERRLAVAGELYARASESHAEG